MFRSEIRNQELGSVAEKSGDLLLLEAGTGNMSACVVFCFVFSHIEHEILSKAAGGTKEPDWLLLKFKPVLTGSSGIQTFKGHIG